MSETDATVVQYTPLRNEVNLVWNENAVEAAMEGDEDDARVGGEQRDRGCQAAELDEEVTIRIRTFSPLEKVLACLTAAFLLLVIVLCATIGILQLRLIALKKAPETCLSEKCISIASKVLAKMDRSVEPCDDFYTFSCGGWLRKENIPPGYSAWGLFDELHQENTAILRYLLERATEPDEPKSHEKARKIYRACMDADQLNKQGVEPLRRILDDLGGWPMANSTWTGTDLQSLLEKTFLNYNVAPLFTMDVSADPNNSDSNIIMIDQGGLSLPHRGFYLNRTENGKIFEAWKKLISQLAKAVDKQEREPRDSEIEDLFEWETKLAESTATSSEREDLRRLYHRTTLAEMEANYPFFNWKQFITKFIQRANSSATVQSETVIVNVAPKFLSQLNETISLRWQNETQKKTLINHVLWQVADAYISFLSESLRKGDEQLDQTIRDVEGQPERWRTCISHTRNLAGWATGSMFVREAFQEKSKGLAEDLVQQVKDVFRAHVTNMTWLGEGVRDYALSKLDTITDRIGYPPFVVNNTVLDSRYADFDADGTLLDAALCASKLAIQKKAKSALGMSDNSDWSMEPDIVNAYYSLERNEMVFPAGILQPPYFDSEQPASMNFGGIGMVMAHELTHGFDHNGRLYDTKGNMHDWWTREAEAAFEKKATCFVDQYSRYKISTGESIDGNQTIDENIADNGGINSAFRAFEEWLNEHGSEPSLPAVPYTSQQLFFIAFAQLWCFKASASEQRITNAVDPHSPPSARVIGSITNSPNFATHFDCDPGRPMNPSPKCDLW